MSLGTSRWVYYIRVTVYGWLILEVMFNDVVVNGDYSFQMSLGKLLLVITLAHLAASQVVSPSSMLCF